MPAEYRPLLDAFGNTRIGGLSRQCTATHIGNGVAITAGHCFNAGINGQTNVACPADTTVYWGSRAGTVAGTSGCRIILAMQNSAFFDYAFFAVYNPPLAEVGFRLDAGSSAVDTNGTLFSHPDGRDLESGRRPATSLPTPSRSRIHVIPSLGAASRYD